MKTYKIIGIIKKNIQAYSGKVLAHCLICVMVMAIVACGSNVRMSNIKADIPASDESTEISDTRMESGSWKIGGIGTDTTSVTADGLAVQFGAQIAVDEINEAGGINGFMIEFSFLEDEDRFQLLPSGTSLDIVTDPNDVFLMSLPDLGRGEEWARYVDENSMDGATSLNNFVTKYKQMHGIVPNQAAAAAYDSVYIVKAVLEESGASPDMSMDDIRDKFKEAMTAVTFDGLTGTGITWDVDGKVSN